MKKYMLFIAGMSLYGVAYAGTSTPSPVMIPSSVMVSSAVVAGAAATLTISSPTTQGPYSAGYYNYLSSLNIQMYATGTLTGGATPVTCTTTGIPGSPVFKFPTAAATGSITTLDLRFSNPVLATQAAQITVVCPATASVIWNITAGYFQSN